MEKTTSRAHIHKGARQQSTEKHRGERRGITKPKRARAGRPRPAGLSCFGPGSRHLCPRCSSIYCLCLRWPPQPSIHQRAAETKEKHREEADGRRKSSSCLGDGCRMDLPWPTTSVGTRTDYSVGPWDYSAWAAWHLLAWNTRTLVKEYSDRILYMTDYMKRTPRRTRLVLFP
jgi:hypothetical protein